MNDWQKGIPLDRLKSFGALFKERHKPFVFGAFGLTKERDIADYVSRERAIWEGEPPTACALYNLTKVASEQKDFAKRVFKVQAKAVFVKAFACQDAKGGEELLRRLLGWGELWVEIFEEDQTAKDAVLAVGLNYVSTKIGAGSEIKGIYTKAAVLDPLPKEEEATQVVLDATMLVDALPAVRAELMAYGDSFTQHYSDYNKRKSWTSFSLRGYQDDPGFIIKPSEMSKSWKEENATLLDEQPRWTKAAGAFPHTVAAVRKLGLKLDRVRFMRLRSKDGELGRHADITDREAGVADGMVSRLHVPIHTSEAVDFMGWDARGNKLSTCFPAGCLFYLDQRKPHAVKNKDPALDRVHLVIDALSNETLRRHISDAFTGSHN